MNEERRAELVERAAMWLEDSGFTIWLAQEVAGYIVDALEPDLRCEACPRGAS